jgi:hypothetical protein
MARMKQLEDPVKDENTNDISDAEFDSIDVSKIKVEVLPDDAAKATHPFDGYPVKKVKIEMPATDRAGKVTTVPKVFNLSDWVLHNHIADPVKQDKSNGRRKNHHSRSIPSLVNINLPNTVVSFCIPIKTENGTYYGAYVPDPYTRSQFIFTLERLANPKSKSNRLVVDKRYMLLDPDQKNRLKQCYLQLTTRIRENEGAADAITAGEEPSNIRDVAYGSTEI